MTSTALIVSSSQPIECPREQIIDYYSILGLDDVRFNATPAQIKAAYRKASIKHHPDKNKDGDESHKNFIDVGKAYQTLISPTKKRQYDSSLSFDDKIPNNADITCENDFFYFYRPVFGRNSIFSKTRPAPELGDPDTPIKTVLAFYRFWRNFQSWRDFTFKAEHDPETAGNREERRWMTKENASQVSDLFKAEDKRIRKLVENAYAADPRVLRFSEENAEQKKSVKALNTAKIERDRKEKAKKGAADQALNAAARERERQAALKAERAADRERIESTKKNLLALFHSFEAEDHIIGLVMGSTPLDRLETRFLGPPGGAEELPKVYQFYLVYSEIVSGEGCVVEWDQKELALLTKAFKKYPVGTLRRWKHITTLLNSAGVHKKEDAIIKKAKELQKGAKAAENGAEHPNSADWSEEQRFLLEKGLKLTKDAFGGAQLPAKERWRLVANLVPGKTAADCVAQVRRIRDAISTAKK